MWNQYLSEITDDMIEGVYNSPQEAHVSKSTPYMEFSNGTTIVFNDKLKQLEKPSEERFNTRFNKNAIVQSYKDTYFSRNPYYNDFRSGRGMWNHDIKNGDKPYFPGTKPSQVKDSHYQAAKNWYRENNKK